MKSHYYRTIAMVIMCAFLLRLFLPVATFAQEAVHKEQINKAAEEFESTYKEIMAVEEIKLGSITAATLWNLWMYENTEQKKSSTNGAYISPADLKTGAENAKALREREKFEGYIAQINRANEDIRKLKWDAIKTRISLKNGSLEKAAETDPTDVYNSLEKGASALAVYQVALKKAGNALLAAAAALETAALALSSVVIVCTAVSSSVVLAPLVVPVGSMAAVAQQACTWSAITIKSAGSALITAADKAIASDKELLEIYSNEFAKGALKEGLSSLVGAGVGKVAGAIGVSAENMWGGLEFNEELSKMMIKELVKPTSLSIEEMLESNLDEMNKHVGDEPTEEEKIMMPAFIKPQLNWD
ncbi:MAG: hypothetical protein A2W80_04640 [Candidatus Riflebacteria bacterium GWC2_50_8]|nr:MAG: hypothetical protein A2W80_04640 [Candidatus Riflebacteria bacterium GWC2_50_8]